MLFAPQNILFGKLRPYLQNWLFPNFQGVALGDFWVFKSKNSDATFGYYLIQTDEFQKVANDTAGTKMPRSDWKIVSVTEFKIPQSLSEQQKIGEFFQSLDNQISQQSQRLDQLKHLKQSLLQQMFI